MSDHFDGTRFFNPGRPENHGMAAFLRWRWSRRPEPWPTHIDEPVAPAPLAAVGKDRLRFSFIGQASVLIQTNGLNILTDPVFSERASPLPWVGPKRVRAPGIALDALPPIHAILLSHNHYDHMDLASLRALAKLWRAPILTGLGNARYLARRGVAGGIDLDWWQAHSLENGIEITFVPAQHWSKRGLFDGRKTLWGGFFINAAAGSVYFAGDTGYPGPFRAIRHRLWSPDVALLPIGAYAPRWFMGEHHMDPEEAVAAFDELGARAALALHTGTFALADEGIDAPAQALTKALARKAIPSTRFVPPPFGFALEWTPETGISPASS
ncbi:MBL fold metallo-hydrolase [Rhodospirillum rubrum]|uniref:MBL fold metallo-hydrolase n=1 Tax=Rhodospirillum rubrum TaxID=1085 RepID=UPI001906C388|nr:MBL fold metallo-hydrolase [Rhodospirillum rubrum]MBK1664299.1 MBL fold metallo-hydrolase [Rhodospirillum rubrum]MBK1675906.1 MBL fold metallo-hydrolase [Rhodospirillum rubrum]